MLFNNCLSLLIIGSYFFICPNTLFIQANNFNQSTAQKIDYNKKLVGFWVTENKDLKVEVFEANGVLYGKLVEFACNHKVKMAMKDHKDEKNPDPKLRDKSWLNTIILYGLKYESDNRWDSGFIYDLTTGKTYSASVSLNDNKIIVRGYWVFEVLGKSLVFKKAIDSLRKTTLEFY